MKGQMNFLDEMIIDNFAGGGGASTGMELALCRPVDAAINHDIEAIRMHELNHPFTKHYCEDVWSVNPVEVTQGRKVALAWFSPDCKHFSKAKGGKPVEKKIRGLAWVAVRWAAMVKPRVIILENVEEFKTWGRVINGKPDPKHKGETFQSFLNALKRLGYEVNWTTAKACDYGAPTIRKRFFLVARCDGMPIVFPKPTHGDKPGLKPYRTAAEIVDFSIPMKSIFDRKKPLAEATMRRIARGIKKFVLDNPKPFIMQMNFENAPQSIDKPLSTLTTVGHHYVVAPTIEPFITQICHSGGDRLSYLNKPLTTIVAKNEHCLVVPSLVQMGYGDKDGKRVLDINTSLGTITAGGNKFALVSALLDQRYGGEERNAANINKPLPTVTTIDHNQLLTVDFIAHQYGTSTGQPMEEPLHTVTQVSKASLVSAFLMKYYGGNGDNGQRLDEPLHTIRTKDCFCLVTIEGTDYIISDIKMRMLEPRELFYAQGFPSDYKIDRDVHGNPISKAVQIARCGNSVCPAVAEAFVKANLPEYAFKSKLTTMSELNHEISICRS